MIWAIVKTFMDSVVDITRKKALDINTLNSPNLFNLLGTFGGLLASIIFIIFGIFKLPGLQGFELVLFIILLIVTNSVNIMISPLWQKIYKNEKISNVLPYENLNNLFIMIVSFFLLSDGNWKTFGVAAITISIIMVMSIDFKNIAMPKNIWLILAVQMLLAADYIIIVFILKMLSEIDFFVISYFLYALMILGVVFLKDGYMPFTKLKKQSKTFWTNRMTASLLGDMSRLISLFLLSDFGPVLAMLLGFLGMFSTLMFSYFFLGDKPEKKSLLLGFIVASLVGIGYWLR